MRIDISPETIYGIYDNLSDGDKARVREWALEELTQEDYDMIFREASISDLLDALNSKVRADSPYDLYRLQQMLEGREFGRALIAQALEMQKAKEIV